MSWPFGNMWILLAAVALDQAAGEPPNRWHPVAAMGWLIETLRQYSPCRGRWLPLIAGCGIVLLGVGLCLAVGIWVFLLGEYWPLLGLLVEVVTLKMMFSLRGLEQAALGVGRALAAGNLAEARRLLSWHLVSRDTGTLDHAHVAAAAVASVAENASDSVVGPWFFYLAGGLPAALAYRFVNTADAMLGYRDAKREWLGKAPARLDDVLNILPARLTAAFIMLSAPLFGGRCSTAFKLWWHDAGKTASPNAGHPMAAAAGALDIELEKVGHYRLGAGNRLPGARDVDRAVGMLYAVAALAMIVALAAFP